jgi:hypothetical protein
VWQIRRQIPTEASGVRQLKKVHHEMIRVCSETSAIVRASFENVIQRLLVYSKDGLNPRAAE